MDTIFAVSSGQPPAAIAIVRVSGREARAAGEKLAGSLPPSRRAGLRRLRDEAGATLDQALILFQPGPNSATGEDLLELHCHGGRAVVAAVERALSLLPGLRRARPGEFTRRAMENGRIDLAQAQGLADLLAAETEAQRAIAMGAAEGRVSQAVGGWMAMAAALAARIEAVLDFADEDDVGADDEELDQIAREMCELSSTIRSALDAPSVDRLRDGLRVAIAGPPNSGKSTLLNLLTERELAIVSPLAGTTRDRIEAAVSREGLPFILTDTAGLVDSTEDEIEGVGVGLALQAIERADLLLWLGDDQPPRDDAIWIHSRADLPGREELPDECQLAVGRNNPHCVKAVWTTLVERARARVPRLDQLALDSRQREHCAAAASSLAQCWADPLIGAELVRAATRELSSLLGLDATEAMLDSLFGQFCIGK